MKVTGYKLQHKLRELHHERDIASAQFDKGKFAFPGEQKVTAKEAFARLQAVEKDIAKLQTAQTQYNLAITVEVSGESMTLCEAVKRVGGAGRMEKMWRSVAAPKQDRFSYRNDDLVRDPSQERAEPTVTVAEAAALAKEAAKFASALREAIQVANATEIEIEIDKGTASLFE